MGQQASGPQPLQCFFNSGNHFQVTLDNANYHEGGQVSGNISFTLDRNTPSISVYITIMGYESVLWRRRVRRGKHTRTETYTDHAVACNQRFIIMQSQDSFLPGHYSYPFNFTLPAGIPGTYVHGSGSYSTRVECSCTYLLYAELCLNHVPPGQNGMVGRTMCPIVVMQQARTPYNYNLEANIDKSVTTWCCCKKGMVNLKCVFEKDVVRMDESVMMKFNVDCTDLKTNLNNVKAFLKRKLYLRTRHGMHTARETKMIELPLPGCDKGGKIEDRAVKFDLSQAHDIGTPANLSGALGEYAGKIQQTCNGQLITVSYELHVKAEVDGCLCYETHPFVYAPIEILAPERQLMFYQYQVALPEYHGDPSQQMQGDFNPDKPMYGMGQPLSTGQTQPQPYPAQSPAQYVKSEAKPEPNTSSAKLQQKANDDTPMEDMEEDV